MDPDEAQDAYEELLEHLQEVGLGWLVDQIEDSHGEPREDPSGRTGEMGERHLSPEEQLEHLLDGVERGIIQPLKMLDHIEEKFESVTMTVPPESAPNRDLESERERAFLPFGDREEWQPVREELEELINELRGELA